MSEEVTGAAVSRLVILGVSAIGPAGGPTNVAATCSIGNVALSASASVPAADIVSAHEIKNNII